MPAHEYTPAQALKLLMSKLNGSHPELAERIQSVIDAGKDVQERQSRGRNGKPRIYRRTIRLSDEEALRVVIEALRAFFVEQPLFVTSAAENFRRAAIGVRAQPPLFTSHLGEAAPIVIEGQEIEKPVEVELQTETQLSREDQQTIPLRRFDVGLIEQQQRLLEQLAGLVHFGS